MTDSNFSIYASAGELRSKYANNEASARDVAIAILQRIRDIDWAMNAYLTVLDEDDVVAQADAADERINNGTATALTGVPFLIKDNISTDGVRTTAGSRILDGYVPMRRWFPDSKMQVRSSSAKETWTSSPWVRRTKTRRLVR